MRAPCTGDKTNYHKKYGDMEFVVIARVTMKTST